jgi:hypothetical protein
MDSVVEPTDSVVERVDVTAAAADLLRQLRVDH